MKHLKKFCIYFIAVFTIAELCGFTGLVIKEVDKGTFYNLATKEALDFCVQLGLAACCNLSGILGYGQRKVDELFPYIGNRAGSCPAFVGNDLLL